MLKKSWLLATLLLSFLSLDAKASCILVEDEHDVERVTNNVHHFYQKNMKNLINMDELGFERHACSKLTQELINSDDDLTQQMIKRFQKNKKNFSRDLQKTIVYFHKNKNDIEKYFGELLLKKLSNGLYFVKKVVEIVS